MNPYYEDESVVLHHGDCLDVMAAMPEASVDAVVTDPPYGLGFMGKEWDKYGGRTMSEATRTIQLASGAGWTAKPYGASGKPAAPAPGEMLAFQQWCEQWVAEAFRLLKPGGHLLAFGGTRTWHRLAVAIENAGFEVRDSIAWLYGSGFPKSLDVSKAIDKQRDDLSDVRRVAAWLHARLDESPLSRHELAREFGVAESMIRHWIGKTGQQQTQCPRWEQWEKLRDLLGFGDEMDAEVWRLNGRKGTPPATPAAQQWQGWGTALKPAFEPVVVARKPLTGTVAQNVQAWGTGALNVDATRIPSDGSHMVHGTVTKRTTVAGDERTGAALGMYGAGASFTPTNHEGGRWPTNVVMDEATAADLDQQTGTLTSGSRKAGVHGLMGYMGADVAPMPEVVGDSGGASRFFPVFRYQAKAPTRERVKVDGVAHPTVKPLALMQWLVRLVTPPGGVVVDPFAGSGTTIEAAILEGFRCIGIERETDYLPLILARVERSRKPTALPGVAEALSLFDFEEPA